MFHSSVKNTFEGRCFHHALRRWEQSLHQWALKKESKFQKKRRVIKPRVIAPVFPYSHVCQKSQKVEFRVPSPVETESLHLLPIGKAIKAHVHIGARTNLTFWTSHWKLNISARRRDHFWKQYRIAQSNLNFWAPHGKVENSWIQHCCTKVCVL